ncbi:MAG: RNA polymerase sigma-70 factor (ECF subfamily) [Akkermansiaceae bacterium]|jgi:RNA polymerase sigma-70 factor (ECF subfamily)
MEDSDEELVALCKKGTLHAFESLVKRYQPRILGFLEKQICSRVDAEDVTQRTFIQAYQSLDRFDSKYRFSPWLFTIARRQGIDFLRQAGSRQRTQEQLRSEPPPAFAADPSMMLGEKENLNQIWRWIWKNLDARSSEVLWLRIQEELNLAEIAGVMKLSRSHVKVLLFRARKSLGKNFARQPESSSPRSTTQPASSPSL